jgi:hypothetical protein
MSRHVELTVVDPQPHAHFYATVYSNLRRNAMLDTLAWQAPL